VTSEAMANPGWAHAASAETTYRTGVHSSSTKATTTALSRSSNQRRADRHRDSETGKLLVAHDVLLCGPLHPSPLRKGGLVRCRLINITSLQTECWSVTTKSKWGSSGYEANLVRQN
jgi:hypothetical protein